MSNALGDWDDVDQDTSPEDLDSDTTSAEEDEPSLVFATVDLFVQEHLSLNYRRTLNVQGGHTWCPEWWRHGEAISRLEALWRAWEDLRRDGKSGMSSWWREHADHHMPILLSTEGPFKGCSVEKGHNPRLDPLPCTPPPAGLFIPQ